MGFLISLDELDRVKRKHGLRTVADLANYTGISRPTWTKVIKTRRPTDAVLSKLEEMDARASKILISERDLQANTAA